MDQLTIPSSSHPLYRTMRKIPAALDGSSAWAQFTTFKTINGIEVAVSAYLQLLKKATYDCCDDISCTFTIIEQGQEEKVLGHLQATVLKKKPSKKPGKKPRWIRRMLRRPKDYKGNMLEHSGLDDEMSDFQKVCQLLYDKRGVPEEHLADDVREMLPGDLLYIESFSLELRYRRRGLTRPAMMSYFSAMNLNSAFRHSGAVALSPAPLANETQALQTSNIATASFDEVVQKLGSMYEGCDFSWCHRSPPTAHGSISIMIRPSTQLELSVDTGCDMSDGETLVGTSDEDVKMGGEDAFDDEEDACVTKVRGTSLQNGKHACMEDDETICKEVQLADDCMDVDVLSDAAARGLTSSLRELEGFVRRGVRSASV